MSLQTYLPVNWMDGMKINKSHFIAQDNAFRYQLCQSTTSMLNDYNHGLLPDASSGEAGIKLFLSLDNHHQVRLRVQRCRAITRGGYFFQFEEDTAIKGNTFSNTLELSIPLSELKACGTSLYIILTFNPHDRVPYGSADPNEVPARIPYTIASAILSLLPEQEVTKNSIGLFQFPVGKIHISEQKVILVENYIPPCTSINSHYALIEAHAIVEQFYARMESYSLQIIQKIIQRKQANDMASIVQRICDNLLVLISSHLAEIKTLNLFQPPVYLISKISSIARLFKNTLDCYTRSGKEELINYCSEWCEISQGELEGCIMDLSNHTYDHLDIDRSISKMTHFTKTISGLFSNLAKLEYIGKRKDAGIFVKERIVRYEPETPVKTRNSFLAD